MERQTQRELRLVILPGGNLNLEWTHTSDAVTKSSQLLQDEIFNRFSEKEDLWLLLIGFADSDIALPPSVDFWRRFSGLFATKLRRTPEIESLRGRVRISVKETELEECLSSAPMMTGVEYLNREMLKTFWNRLNRAFSRAIAPYEGSVESFIRKYSPNTKTQQ